MGKKRTITNTGKKQILDEDVKKDIDKTIESKIRISPQYHRHFAQRRGHVIRHISEELGGVQINFPKAGSSSSRVTLKGASECVEAAKKRLTSIVDDLSRRVTIDVIINQKHHRTIMGSQGNKVKQIQSDHNVDIKFPECGDEDDLPEENGDGIRTCDIIRVSGCAQNCEGAKTALLDQVPVTIEVDIPFKMHRFVIGQSGKDVRALMKIHDVHITVPPSDQQSDTIKITGSPQNAEAAKKALLKLKKDLEEKERDREAKSFEARVQVDPKFHTKITGESGDVIDKIRKACNVSIELPKRGDNLAETSNEIFISGNNEEQTNQAKKKILAIVNDTAEPELRGIKKEADADQAVDSKTNGSKEKNVRQNPIAKRKRKTVASSVKKQAQEEDVKINIDKLAESTIDISPQYHHHFAQRRGELIRQISEELGGVQIKFPKPGSASSRVTLKGASECVEAAKKRLVSVAEDLSQRVTIDVVIDQKHHRGIMGSHGKKVKQIQLDHKVDIKFPERVDENNLPEKNGDGIRPCDIIRVSGRPENCEAAKTALLDKVPVKIEIEVPTLASSAEPSATASTAHALAPTSASAPAAGEKPTVTDAPPTTAASTAASDKPDEPQNSTEPQSIGKPPSAGQAMEPSTPAESKAPINPSVMNAPGPAPPVRKPFFRGRRSKMSARTGRKEIIYKEEPLDPEIVFKDVEKYVAPAGVKLPKFWDSEDELSEDEANDNFRRIMCGFGTNCRVHEVIRPTSEIVRRMKELQNTFGSSKTLPLFQMDGSTGPELKLADAPRRDEGGTKKYPPITWHNDPKFFQWANNCP